ncbi:hypothetical protein [Streptococcus anginosus]|uniref:Uncharacterized protein n=5 Tax=root TaxID=1 RepID=I0SFN9_STRAP|nr:hypothetical protein [Streptococcus anginosus]AGU84051.1 putative phage protein [Streptococcus anginosus C238]EID22192.1 hypothetical protein HMPREF1043_0918 [Streptococcus anginosus subsp. whileyi CCUG 39159]MDB8661962.1 hypothetical protein [Streptococcus anginosus]MDP1384626.1 hypothetical protein [Streptococcus anginosus]QQT08345.1 hypothetical protein I6J12_07165 [Streptococcus anginosus]
MVSTKELKCYFYQLNSNFEIRQKINSYFSKLANQKKIKTETISDFSYYIKHDIVKKEEYVLFTIAKVDTLEEVKLDDVETQERSIIDKEETQGLAKDAQFLYNFKSGILVQKRGQGQINIKDFQIFISQKLNIDDSAFKFSLIKDENGLKKLDSLNQIHDFVLNVSIPKQLSLFADDVDGINSGIELAKKMQGDSVDIAIHGESLCKRTIIDSVKLVGEYRKNQNMKVTSLSIYGDNEVIDLVKYKLQYYKKYCIDEFSTEDIYSFLEEAYANKKDYLNYYENEDS